MKRLLTFISALFAACIILPAQDAGRRSRLDRDSILIGDQVVWSVPVTVNEGQTAAFFPPEEPVAPGIETIIPFHIDTISAKKGKLSMEGRMVVTSFDSGSFHMPPLAVVMMEKGHADTLVFEGPVLEVNTIPVDTATFQPYDIKGQITYPVTFREVFPWVLLVFAFAAIVWFVVRYIVNRRNNKDFFGRSRQVDPPHVVALRDLEKIRGQKLWQNNRQKQFYTAVTDVLRQYMAGRYDFPAMEQTTAEIMDSLKDRDIDPRLMDEVKDLLSTADYVKFAKHSASDLENENAIPTAVRFVNSTFLQQLEDEKEDK